MRWVQFLLAERTILFAAAGSILLAIVWICVIGGQESASDRRAREEKRKRDDKRSWREVRGHGRGIGRGAGEGARGGDADRAEARPALPAKEVTTRVVTTDAGPLLLTIEGSDKLPHTIVTVHDVGTNHRTCFNAFFQAAAQDRTIATCRVIHVTVPGQEDGAATMTSFPSLDNIAARIVQATHKLHVNGFMGFGVGAGVNILLRVVNQEPRLLNGLISVGGSRTKADWTEMLYSLYVEGLISTLGLNDVAKSAIINQHCGRDAFRGGVSRDLASALADMNAHNLKLFMSTYRRRNTLEKAQLEGLAREDVPVLAIAGTLSRGALPFIPVTPTEINALNIYKVTAFQLSARIPMKHGDWVTVEAPTSLLEPVTLFFKAIGFA